MNIFVTDRDPTIAAKNLCDKHIVKMCLESVQMISAAMIIKYDIAAPYKLTHKNHPCNVWLRESEDNFTWLVKHALEIGTEYIRRYEKLHLSHKKLIDVLPDISHIISDYRKVDNFVLAMPEKYKTNDPVESYRRYYIGDKSNFAKWKLGNIPDWFTLS